MTTTPIRLHADLSAERQSKLAAQSTAQRAPSRPQVRRYTVSSLLPNGNISETRHLAPALPLFEDAFCAFARGSQVETEIGPMAIEDLLPGDRVITVNGESQPVVWKGNLTIVPGMRHSQKRDMKLTRFMADSFGMSRPMSNMIAGPSARLLHTPEQYRSLTGENRILSPVQAFVDGENVVETAPPTAVELYHLCLPRHAAIKVGGLEFESYHPGTKATQMMSHAMRSLFLNMFAHVSSISDFGSVAYPRAGEGQIQMLSA